MERLDHALPGILQRLRRGDAVRVIESPGGARRHFLVRARAAGGEPGAFLAAAVDMELPPGTPPPIHRVAPHGVLDRAEAAEAAVDLCRIAGLAPAAWLTEVPPSNEEDRNAVPLHGLVAFRRQRERPVAPRGSVALPTRFGVFDLHLFTSDIDGQEHVVLTRGLPEPGELPSPAIEEAVLGRVHSECLTGDLFGSMRCDCGEQLHAAMAAIAAEERGFLVYLRQEGRGIGLANKLRAYALQDQGLDTVEANTALGFAPDLRSYGSAACILHHLGLRTLRLLTNNPAKHASLGAHGLIVAERLPLKIKPNSHNANYLDAKRTKLGHLL